jgi:homogentisate 1,2-dioxygenase
MRKNITFPRTCGLHSKQAHVDLPAGTYEREFGREGFFGPATHIYHQHPPTSWSKWEGNLRPLAFDTVKLTKKTNSPWDAEPLLYNNHMRMGMWKTSGKMQNLVRNADGDELLFIHAGSGDLFCDFGHMKFSEGDYIILPRSTMWRIECEQPASILMIEATSEGYLLPDKGLLGTHAIFDPAILEVPAINEQFKAQYSEKEAHVVLKRNNEISTMTYPYNPLDAVGWKGDNLPVKLNWRDIRPIMSHRYHLAPSVHTTFLTPRFVVCTFVPRPFETDPGALKVPFYHSNNDFDEIIFYHMGEFFSRDNIHPGMITLHPCGFPHGPHPKAFAASKNNTKTSTDEVAVMVDTRDSVEVSKAARKVEWKGYVDSWKDKK